MNATEFLAVLNTMEQDHQLVLDKIQALKDSVADVLGSQGEDAHKALSRLREYDSYFATQFEAHLDEEEITLFPLLQKCRPEGAQLVDHLRQEHDEIRRKREEFENCLDVAAQLGVKVPRSVLRDVLAYGWELWELLDNHAHVETRAVHECLARYFLEEEAAGKR
jgi:iron-sulfur cluster repair protein YtfE (RIC family)